MVSKPQPFGILYTFSQLLHLHNSRLSEQLNRLPPDIRGVAPFQDFMSSLLKKTIVAGQTANGQASAVSVQV